MSAWALAALVILGALCGFGVAVVQDASRRLDDGMQRINDQIDRKREAAMAGSQGADLGDLTRYGTIGHPGDRAW